MDARERRLLAYEALVRGPDQDSAASILAKITDHNRDRFDQACRVRASELAARLKFPAGRYAWAICGASGSSGLPAIGAGRRPRAQRTRSNARLSAFQSSPGSGSLSIIASRVALGDERDDLHAAAAAPAAQRVDLVDARDLPCPGAGTG